MDIRMLLNLRDPITNALKRAPISDIVNEQNTLRAAEIARSDGTEPLLARSIPDLQLDARAVNVHVFDLKVNANGRDKCWRK